MEGFLAVVAIIIVAFILFCIYFIFKQIQFVLVAVNLYKKMVRRQDAIIKLLLDIRDSTKKYDQKVSDVDEEDESSQIDDDVKQITTKLEATEEDRLEFCYHCGAELSEKTKLCPECKKPL